MVMTMKTSWDRLKKSTPAKFFFAVAGRQKEYLPKIENLLAGCCGGLGLRSEIYRFSDFSTYYDAEMGGTVWKYLVCSRGLLPPEDLVRIKQRVEEIQAGLLSERSGSLCRDVNIDPGYINGWQVVLASVKNFTHRIYLGGGVYAETTLLFQKGQFQSLPWTYADYKSDPVLAFLQKAREEWREESRAFENKPRDGISS
jgi:hypothetical protein